MINVTCWDLNINIITVDNFMFMIPMYSSMMALLQAENELII